MKTKEAVNRLLYTIGKSHKPNETDKIALNSLIKYINNFEEETIQENLLFAKLYTFVLSNFVKNYSDIDFANKQLNKELETTLQFQMECLLIDIRNCELSNFFKAKGIKDDFVTGRSFEEIGQVMEQNKEVFKNINAKEFLSVYDSWDIDNVKAHLNRNINESLNTYKNV